MRPLLSTVAGVALGLAAVLPLTRDQLLTSSTQPSVSIAADGTQPPGRAMTPGAAGTQPPSVVTRPGASAATGAPPAPEVSSPTAAPLVVTATGPAVSTRYGPVQVQVVLTGDQLTSATAVTLPSGDRESRQINRVAGPRLAASALAGQSARIDTVSGATWTSDGYRRSLQAALDAARAQLLAAASNTAATAASGATA